MTAPQRERHAHAYLRAVFTGVVLVLALTYTGLSTRLSFHSDGQPGAGFFPTILGVLFSAVALAALVSDLAKARAATGPREPEESFRPKDSAILAVLSLGYVVLFLTVGVLVATVVFCVAAMAFLTTGNRIKSALVVLPVPILVVLALNALTGGSLIAF